MRKAFTVATVFTGAATCAAAFTPTTAAATDEAHVTVRDCSGATTTSMVLYWVPSERHGPTCIGGYGGPYSVSLSGSILFTGYCTGGNSGTFFVDQNKTPFEAGETVDYPGSPPVISKVRIQKRRVGHICEG
jgi:hypothetical protein